MSSVGEVVDHNQTVRPIAIDEPEFNMNKYTGRVRYFFKILNPMNSFYSYKSIMSMKAELE